MDLGLRGREREICNSSEEMQVFRIGWKIQQKTLQGQQPVI